MRLTAHAPGIVGELWPWSHMPEKYVGPLRDFHYTSPATRGSVLRIPRDPLRWLGAYFPKSLL